MNTTSTADPRDPVVLTCIECRREIDWCEFCDEIDCGVPICYRCMNRVLEDALFEPHQHGG
jgi:hypothetical protein